MYGVLILHNEYRVQNLQNKSLDTYHPYNSVNNPCSEVSWFFPIEDHITLLTQHVMRHVH